MSEESDSLRTSPSAASLSENALPPPSAPAGYVCSLTEELVARAREELQEKPEWRLRDVQALRDMVRKECPDLRTSLEDAFLLRFLRARKFDYDRALQLLINYHSCRRSWPEVFNDLRPSAVREVLASGFLTVLPHTDPRGCPVLCLRPGTAPRGGAEGGVWVQWGMPCPGAVCVSARARLIPFCPLLASVKALLTAGDRTLLYRRKTKGACSLRSREHSGRELREHGARPPQELDPASFLRPQEPRPPFSLSLPPTVCQSVCPSGPRFLLPFAHLHLSVRVLAFGPSVHPSAPRFSWPPNYLPSLQSPDF